jgi:hypothetical protein
VTLHVPAQPLVPQLHSQDAVTRKSVHPNVILRLCKFTENGNLHCCCAGGLLYFAGPSSAIDQIMYNAHRIYGPVRLPLLTANWEVLGVYDDKFKTDQCGSATCDGLFTRWREIAPLRHYEFQPVLVLRNQRTTPCSTVAGNV